MVRGEDLLQLIRRYGWGRRRDDARSHHPLVVHVEPGLDQHRPQLLGPLGDGHLDAVHAPPERVVDGGAEAEPAGHAVLPVLEPARRRVPIRTGRPRRAAPRDDRAVTAGADRGSTCARRETRCRVDRAGTCGPSPPTGHSRSRRRRCGAGRPTDTRRAGTAHPAARVSDPTSAAGFTSPPFVGMWVSDTRATSCRASRSAIASTSTWPYRSLGTRSTRTPRRSAATRNATMFAPYSWSWTTIVWPGAIGTDQNAAFHAAVACSVRAISDGCAADESGDRVVDGQTSIERRTRGLVAAVDRLGLEVADLGVEHDLGRQRRTGMVEMDRPGNAPGCDRPGPVDLLGAERFDRHAANVAVSRGRRGVRSRRPRSTPDGCRTPCGRPHRPAGRTPSPG